MMGTAMIVHVSRGCVEGHQLTDYSYRLVARGLQSLSLLISPESSAL